MESCVPVIEISDENFELMWPAIQKAIKNASFIALDCELSGLGNRKKLNFPEVDLRYKYTCEIAEEYSIVSLGLSCYFCHSLSHLDVDSSDGKSESVRSQNYFVQTFNILTLCTTPYTVECASLKFLASHGFDFNKQYTHGLPYSRVTENKKCNNSGPMVRDIFTSLLKSQKPVVFHNGYIDLIFLYHSFYSELPKNPEVFAADLSEMFPNGIYDTKYISEFHATYPATFLEYIFKKIQLDNEDRLKNGNWHVRLNFPPYPDSLAGLNWHPYEQVHLYSPSSNNSSQLPRLCNSYKFHGWCAKGESCGDSHDINRIVRELENGKKNKSGGPVMTGVAFIISTRKQNLLGDEPKKQRVRKRRRTTIDSSVSSSSICGINTSNNGINNDDTEKRCNNADDGHSHSPAEECELPEGVSPSKDNESLNGSHLSDINDSKIDNRHDRGDFNGSQSLVLEEDTEEIPVITLDDSPRTTAQSATTVKDTFQSARCSGHRAGFDAFMTGYIFACTVASQEPTCDPHNYNNPTPKDFNNAQEMKLDHLISRIYLIGKEFPFLVRKSTYSKTSFHHDNLIYQIRHTERDQ